MFLSIFTDLFDVFLQFFRFPSFRKNLDFFFSVPPPSRNLCRRRRRGSRHRRGGRRRSGRRCSGAVAATAAAAKISARRRHGKKKIKIFTKTWKTKKLQKTSKKSMEIDKNIDFGGAGNKRTSPSNSTRKTILYRLIFMSVRSKMVQNIARTRP